MTHLEFVTIRHNTCYTCYKSRQHPAYVCTFEKKLYGNISTISVIDALLFLSVTLSATNESICLTRCPTPIHLITSRTAGNRYEQWVSALEKTRVQASARFLFRCVSIIHIKLTNCISSKIDRSVVYTTLRDDKRHFVADRAIRFDVATDDSKIVLE